MIRGGGNEVVGGGRANGRCFRFLLGCLVQVRTVAASEAFKITN